MDRTTTCCFTGHRKLPRGSVRHLIPRVTDGIKYLVERGYRDFITGGALGFDTVAARALICMKISGYDIGFHLVLPCKDQDRAWSSYDRAAFREILTHADTVRYLSDSYTPTCMAQRNREMVNLSSACIAFVSRPRSGAGQTLRMANEAGLTVYNLAHEFENASD